jgi:hypothetical protein
MMDMKKNDAQLPTEFMSQVLARKSWRRPIHWLPRYALALLLALLVAATTTAALASLRPLYITLPMPVYDVTRSAAIDYQVDVRSVNGIDVQKLGENQIYLSELAQTIHPHFTYTWNAVDSSNLTWTSTISGTLRVIDIADKDRVLFEKKTVLDPAVLETKTANGFTIDRAIAVDLADFRAQADAFAQQSRISIRTELVIALDVLAEAKLANGTVSLTDQPALIVPLTADTFRITKELAKYGQQIIWRWIPFQMVMAPIPFYWYPVVGAVLLAGLVLWLTMTKIRRKDRFEKQLARMQRMARGQLMLISDKAWEPEWCITATDYKTMVKTARKLKHPVFCHVDRTGEIPTAFFYVYYGENNYCLTFRAENQHDDQPSLILGNKNFTAMPESGPGFDHQLNPDE